MVQPPSPTSPKGDGIPVLVYPAAPPRSLMGSLASWLLRLVLVVSLLLNAYFLARFVSESSEVRLVERRYSGPARAGAKVAVVRVHGLLLEGFTSYAAAQLKSAAQDPDVRAVVLAINSPGGSVTASDVLWKQIQDLRDGKWDRQDRPKPVIAAMESVAASGGYYVAVPAQKIFAQPTTITGSIGVYAAFLDIHQLAQKHGVDMTYIKRGELKASGSMFKPMTPEERLEWQGLIDSSFRRFLEVVQEGREGRLKHALRTEFKLESPDGPLPQVRRLADGGVYTAREAKDLGLVDDIGYLDDAIRAAGQLAGLTEVRAITYDRPMSFLELIVGARAEAAERSIPLRDVPGLSARLWYLTPGFELSGIEAPASWLR
jgi:protease-4